jgi:hypothetical protein
MQGDGQQQAPAPGQQPDTQWQYRPEQTAVASDPSYNPAKPAAVSTPAATISWTASEYIAHHKTPLWYVGFIGISLLAAAILYFFTRDWVSVAGVVLMGAILIAAAARRPNTLTYTLSAHGVAIGQREYSYDELRSFSVVHESAFPSIVFLPLKRFMPPLSVYYDPADEEHILELLSRHLPVVPASNDLVDRLMRHVRF